MGRGGGSMTGAAIVMAVATLLGSATIAGVFFAFSSFIMKALARLPAPAGIAAMQSINIAVINRSFLGVFMGTALLSVSTSVIAFNSVAMLSAYLFLLGTGLYVIGTFLVTILGNVPLNKQLEAISADASDAIFLWERYLRVWTMLNTVRTAAAMVAALVYALGLLYVNNF